MWGHKCIEKKSLRSLASSFMLFIIKKIKYISAKNRSVIIFLE